VAQDLAREGGDQMICGRCDKWIRPGVPYETRDITSPSAGGTTIYFHKEICAKKPFQVTQGSIRH
jgi:hypothetical protein